MVKVIRIPVEPVPQEFTYVLELSEDRATFLRGILRNHRTSVTASEILQGLHEVELPEKG